MKNKVYRKKERVTSSIQMTNTVLWKVIMSKNEEYGHAVCVHATVWLWVCTSVPICLLYKFALNAVFVSWLISSRNLWIITIHNMYTTACALKHFALFSWPLLNFLWDTWLWWLILVITISITCISCSIIVSTHYYFICFYSLTQNNTLLTVQCT